jgi:dehydrogenase/reductase SDR family member 12
VFRSTPLTLQTDLREVADEDLMYLVRAETRRTGSMINSLLDTILDRTVVAGYTHVGYRIRMGMWSPADLQPMDGKVVLVTGATAGLGLAAAESFARLGAAVRLLARSEERGEHARAEIVDRSGNSDVQVSLCDLSDLKAVRRFASRFSAEAPSLDVLVNNAGALTSERTLSVDGVELTFATNVLGPFLLTNLLIPLLKKSAPARIINVSSGGMYTRRIQAGDLQTAREEFDGAAVYARTKRAQVILTELWAERLKGTGIVVHAMHPGWADTPGLKAALPVFYRATRRLLRTPQQGADTIVWLGAAPQPARSSGGFWHDRRERPTHRVPWTKETLKDREQLWAECERLSGGYDIRIPASAHSNP